jgi:hypothetical protein
MISRHKSVCVVLVMCFVASWNEVLEEFYGFFGGFTCLTDYWSWLYVI